MPKTVRAKLLLGWMSQHEAVNALNACTFDEPLTGKKTIALWKEYQDKVIALEPRNPIASVALPLTDGERQAVEDHIRRINGSPKAMYLPQVIKIHPGDLVAKQFHIVTE